MHELPKVIFQLDLADADAREGDGLAVAIEPRGYVLIQFAVAEATLRGFSEDRPPSCRMEPDAAIELAREILKQLDPTALAPASRPVLRLVGSDGPEAA